MSLSKAVRFVIVAAMVWGGATVAPAHEAVRGDASPTAEPQEPVAEPAPDAPVAGEGPASPSPRPGRPAPPAKAAPRVRPAAEAQLAPATPPAPAVAQGEQVNVRVDLKIRAQRGSATPVEKILALVVIGDDSRTAVRTASSVPFPVGGSGNFQYRDLSLNADVRAIVGGRRIRVALSLDYNFAIQATEGEGRGAGPTTSSVRNEIRAVLEDGKALVVSDQVDAASDYRVTVEAKATILR
jgi:hypothetical protein